MGLLINVVLQVLSSWENQTVLQCLKHHRKNCFTFNIFWELKMESFGEATSKETCFSLYLEKGKLFIQLFWLLSFTMVAKNNTFSVEFLLPWKENLEKSDVVKHELRERLKARVEIQKWFHFDESQVQIHEFKFTSY